MNEATSSASTTAAASSTTETSAKAESTASGKSSIAEKSATAGKSAMAEKSTTTTKAAPKKAASKTAPKKTTAKAAPKKATTKKAAPKKTAAKNSSKAKKSGDDFTKLSGIGPSMEATLKGLGIDTYAKLAGTDDDILRDMLEESGARLNNNKEAMDSWNEQATLASKGDFDGLKKMQEALKK